MSTNVECDRELMGLKVRLPHSFNQISERMFSRIGDLKPALMKASDTFWARSVMLPSSSPIGKPVSLDVLDDARSDQCGSRVDDATQYAVCRNFGADESCRIDALDALAFVWTSVFVEVPERNAVLHGDDDGVRPEQFGHVFRYRVYLMGFQGQNDHVLRTRFIVAVRGFDVFCDVLGSIFHYQLHAVVLDGLEVGSPHDEGDVFSR